jgi:phosphohistidine phosphatase
MKKLYLVRHAKSSWDNSSLKDIERPLNNRGKRDAPFMGRLLKKKDIKPDLMITSCAVRALKTAKIFCKEMGIAVKDLVVEENLYEAGRKDILKVINEFDNTINSVMLFAHNPGLIELAKFLTSGEIDTMPTCSIAAINCMIESWIELYDINCNLEFFEYPKKYFN